jgi:hypothetical protein
MSWGVRGDCVGGTLWGYPPCVGYPVLGTLCWVPCVKHPVLGTLCWVPCVVVGVPCWGTLWRYPVGVPCGGYPVLGLRDTLC